jgi:hypothetical protein
MNSLLLILSSDPLPPLPIDKETTMKLSPLKIELLLHIYCKPVPFDHPPAKAYGDAKEEFFDSGLIAVDDTKPCGFYLTERGKAFIRLILATPLPEPSNNFIDPRTGEPV